mmetsp:Transcript_24110/g.27816  ORF Transcript_24110/g.27816 Transcript_24110/m.27816 type:complete len:82 (+) Transcript_24110:115-360(+)
MESLVKIIDTAERSEVCFQKLEGYPNDSNKEFIEKALKSLSEVKGGVTKTLTSKTTGYLEKYKEQMRLVEEELKSSIEVTK